MSCSDRGREIIRYLRSNHCDRSIRYSPVNFLSRLLRVPPTFSSVSLFFSFFFALFSLLQSLPAAFINPAQLTSSSSPRHSQSSPPSSPPSIFLPLLFLSLFVSSFTLVFFSSFYSLPVDITIAAHLTSFK